VSWEQIHSQLKSVQVWETSEIRKEKWGQWGRPRFLKGLSMQSTLFVGPDYQMHLAPEISTHEWGSYGKWTWGMCLDNLTRRIWTHETSINLSQTRPACLDGRQCSGLCDPKAKCAFDYFLLAHNGDNRWDMFPQRSHDYRHRIALWTYYRGQSPGATWCSCFAEIKPAMNFNHYTPFNVALKELKSAKICL